MNIEKNLLPIMVTIPQAAALCTEHNIGVSAYQLRRLCKENRIPCYRIGVKTLLNWNGFLAFLENPIELETVKTSAIRALPARLERQAN